jgi:hypothetical protein
MPLPLEDVDQDEDPESSGCHARVLEGGF